MKLFLGWVALVSLVSPETAIAGQKQQRHLNQESSQLLRGASEPKTLKAATPVYNTIVAWNDINGEISDSPEPVELETPYDEGEEFEGTVVNDVYVRWDQDECNPCEVPTLPPTLPPLYPHSDDSYEDHPPVVTDEYDSWDDIKEGHTSASTDAPTEDQDEEEDEIVYSGGIRCSKITTTEGEVYQCESPEGNVYCTKVATEYGQSYDCHPGTVQPPDTTAQPTNDYEPTPTPTNVETLVCPNGEQSIGVAGWDHNGCVISGNVCVANAFGDCPRGAHCARLDTGVYGCKDGQGCANNEQTIGVVGWDHDGCIVSDNICVAQVKNGDCPAGAYCSLLETGVYGCVAASTPAPTSPYDSSPMILCPNGEQRIGVAGWDHDGCVVSGNVCVASAFGDCPRGAHCARLDTGVYGCKDGQGCANNEQTIGVVGWDHDGCIVSDNICVAQVKNGDCPAGAYCSLLETGVYGCVAASTPAPTSPYDSSPMILCPNGEQRIGVAGWDHDGCVVSGNVCVASAFGDCPRGAHCARLDTGVYGCKDGQGCANNEQTIGVVGWDHDGCIVSDNICVAQVKNGDCPAGAYCSLLETGVYGCVAASTPAPTSPYDSSPMILCPNGEQRIGVAGWDHDGCVVSGNVCVASAFGDCPRGAHCARLDTGVYGCKDGQGCANNEQTIGVVGWDHDGCIVSDNICVAQVKNGDCPAGAYCSLLETGVYGCVAASTPAPTSPYDSSPMILCPNGEQRIGVAGWDHDGCVVSGNVCVASAFGDCPRGAHCARLDTGVYGCKDGQGCANNEQTIGVVGWDHDGCIVSDNICVAQVKNGDCPAGAYCSLLETGVYGCVAASTPAPTSPYDSSPMILCPNGEQRIGVAGWDHDGCVVSGNVCVASAFGDCPRGAHCARLDTGVYGCKDGQGCANNEQTIGVVGWDHDGCIVSDNICVAQVKNGDCPAGAYCSLLETGVYGCVAASTPAPTSPYDSSPMILCPNGEQRIGVAGWDHDGCVVSGNVCVASAFGDCPRGAHCARLDTGVYGCKDGQGCANNEQTIGVVGWDHDGCIVSDNICVAQVKNGDCPAGAYCSLLETGVYGCVAASTPAPTSPYDSSPMILCPNGEQRIGVAGWDHDGCVVSGNVCVASAFGDCPRGAHCARLDTGVYGCKDGQGCANNEQTIGVVGWDHDGCIVSDNICVAQVKNGDCPAGAYCSLLETGVYGCVAASTPAPTSPYDSSPMILCPNGEQRIGVAGWDHDGCVVSGNVCVASAFGDCPRGAHCARLDTGVYGCKDGQGCANNEQTIGVVGWDHDGCIVSDNICVAQVKNGDCPAGAYCSLLETGVYGCVAASTPAPTSPYDSSPMILCPNGEQRIGVAGWDHDGCVVSGNVCVASAFGDCPRGAHCARLDTGVYGCKDGQGCANNEQTIGVVGWDHDGCIVSDNICVAQVKNGDCPAGAYCSLLETGVYGCVAASRDTGGTTKNGESTSTTSSTTGGTSTAGTTGTTGGRAITGTTSGDPTIGGTSTGTTTGDTTGTTTGGVTTGGTSTGTTTSGTTTASTGTSTEDTSNTNTGATSTPSTGAYGGDTANTAGATTTDSNTASAKSPTDAEGLSAGAIVGIVIGCAVFVAIVVGAVLSWQKSLARQREENLFADLSDTGGATDYAAM